MSHLFAAAQTGPWAGGDVPLASRSSRQMAVAARAFLNGLGADQLGSVQYPDLSDPARTRWSNLPAVADATAWAAELMYPGDRRRRVSSARRPLHTAGDGAHEALEIGAEVLVRWPASGDQVGYLGHQVRVHAEHPQEKRELLRIETRG
jgi:hypothetical protein